MNHHGLQLPDLWSEHCSLSVEEKERTYPSAPAPCGHRMENGHFQAFGHWCHALSFLQAGAGTQQSQGATRISALRCAQHGHSRSVRFQGLTASGPGVPAWLKLLIVSPKT